MMVRTHLQPAGEFRCSNELFNRIHEITVHTYLTQTPMGVLGGGEPREKQGYGDAGSFLTGMLYNFGSDGFFRKWLQDWCDNQRPDGGFGNVAPTQQRGEGGGRSGADRRANWCGGLTCIMGIKRWPPPPTLP